MLLPPLLTCEAVLTEACFLVRNLAGGPAGVMELLGRQVVRLDFDLSGNVDQLGTLLRRYASVPMSLADACLVRMAGRQSGSRILTIDQDFRLYRIHGRNIIPLLVPPAG